ncbi:glycosyltransferase family 2 protein [Thiolapillus sp.]
MEKTDTPENTTTAENSRCSAVIVNFNSGELLLECLAAVYASTLPVEVILVDNASTDGSAARARKAFPQLHLIQNTSNSGFAAAANQGLRAAGSEYLLLLNPDCILQPDTLEAMLKSLEDDPRAGMAGCRILNPDGSEQRGCRRNLPTLGSGLRKAAGVSNGRSGVDLHQQPLPDQPRFVEAISGAFMLARRAAVEEVGLLDEQYFLHCEDLDWCRRFHDAGWKILFAPRVEIVHHQGACSKATPVRVSWHKHRGMVRYYRKFLAGRNGLLLSAFVIPGIYARFVLLAMTAGIKRLGGGR